MATRRTEDHMALPNAEEHKHCSNLTKCCRCQREWRWGGCYWSQPSENTILPVTAYNNGTSSVCVTHIGSTLSAEIRRQTTEQAWMSSPWGGTALTGPTYGRKAGSPVRRSGLQHDSEPCGAVSRRDRHLPPAPVPSPARPPLLSGSRHPVRSVTQ